MKKFSKRKKPKQTIKNKIRIMNYAKAIKKEAFKSYFFNKGTA